MSIPDYKIAIHRAVRKFLRTHPELADKWDSITSQIQASPRMGTHVDHLKAPWFCSHRWDEGTYRIKYDIIEDDREIYFYDANNRGDVYKGRRGAGRRR